MGCEGRRGVREREGAEEGGWEGVREGRSGKESTMSRSTDCSTSRGGGYIHRALPGDGGGGG